MDRDFILRLNREHSATAADIVRAAKGKLSLAAVEDVLNEEESAEVFARRVLRRIAGDENIAAAVRIMACSKILDTGVKAETTAAPQDLLASTLLDFRQNVTNAYQTLNISSNEPITVTPISTTPIAAAVPNALRSGR